MSTNARFAKILEQLAELERERGKQDATWKAIGPELERAGKSELWVESLPEPAPEAVTLPAFLSAVRA